MRSPTRRSVSRDAVPLPTATSSARNWRAREARVRIEPSQSLRGGCGWMTPVWTTLPVRSMTASLTPVRMPGSRPMVALIPAGAASSKLLRLRAKTSIAATVGGLFQAVRQLDLRGADLSSSAKPSEPSRSARNRPARPLSAMPNRAEIRRSHSPAGRPPPSSSSPGCNFKRSMFSLRPRNRASARCDGIA